MRKIFILSLAFLIVLWSPVFADSAEVTIAIMITNNDVDSCNYSGPASGSFQANSEFLAHTQVYESGVTNSPGQGADIYAWIGYSESDTDPSGTGWTWVVADYAGDAHADRYDEYTMDLGAEISDAGTYFVASRFSRDNVNFKYGGYSSSGGGFWDGSTNVSVEYTVTVNTPPILAAIGNQTLTEDIATFIQLSASDGEDNTITFAVSGGNPATVLAVVRNDTLFFTPADDYFTAEPILITITAEDGYGGSDSETFEVTVNAVNDAPVIAILEDQNGSEGIEMTFGLSASDVDSNTLTWTSENLPTGAVFTDHGDGTATFIWTPNFNQAGTYSNVQFIVDDNQGEQALLRVATRGK